MKQVSSSVLPGYGVAGASTALATLAQFPLRPLVGSQHPYWFFYVAVLVTAWYAGLRRALLALALGALSANYFFLPPAYSLAIAGTANQIGLVLYLLAALVGTFLIEALRQQQRPDAELVQSQAALLAREQTARAIAAEAQHGARTLAGQLKMARAELAQAGETVQRQQDEIDQLTAALQRRSRTELSAGSAESLPRLPIRGAHSLVLLRVLEIDYAECRNRQVFVRTSGRELSTSYTLADLETLLPAEIFFRAHDAYLVNLDRIVALVFLGSESHEVRLSDGQRLPLGPGRCQELRRRLGLDEQFSS